MIKNFLLAAFAVLFTVNTADAGVIFESAGDQDYGISYQWTNIPGSPSGTTTNYFVGSTFSPLTFTEHPCETFTDACFEGEMYQGPSGSYTDFEAYLVFHSCDVDFPSNPQRGWNYLTQECLLEQEVRWYYPSTGVEWEGTSQYGKVKQEALWYCGSSSCSYHGTINHVLTAVAYTSSTTDGVMEQSSTGYYGTWYE